MLIHTLSDLYDPGYIAKERNPFITPFFGGGNVAFRREVFEEVGMFDENCHWGEDRDMAIRLAKANKTLYFQPKAVVKHKNTDSLLGFLRKWFLYGKGNSYLFKKHSANNLEVYIPGQHNPSGSLYRLALAKKDFPIKVGLFINSFLLSFLLLISALILLITGHGKASLWCFIPSMALLLFYMRPFIDKNSPWESIKLSFLAYLLNLSYLMGGLVGGLKQGILYVSEALIIRAG